jgi:hypothetical protein
MSEIYDSGSVTPRQEATYRKEYREGVVLFQKALQQMNKNEDYLPKKEAFMGVMDQAMKVLNQTAGELKNKELLRQNAQIAKDYAAYQEHPSKERLHSLQNDLKLAKEQAE